MPDNTNQPREYDAVLGGQAPPVDGLVLGGIESVKRGLNSLSEETQITSLYHALKYEEASLEIIIQALNNKSIKLKFTAYNILKNRTDKKVKEVLKNYSLYQFFDCLSTITQHLAWVKAVVISPNGQTLISGSGDKTIKIWDLKTKEKICIRTHDFDYPTSLAISPDGQTFVSESGNNIIQVWKLDTGREIFTLKGHEDSVYAVAITPDG
ncbi:hypothetical protein H6G94_20470 [Nostoc punctiforme FACHB-252]|uniref:Uncharacterized protein n=1 Tax=Nostoc punctiforme FACHB-252 TaxID=1357509 RepID=A0ABR8HCU5_NOSPU|nr:hypothetical protein [Nostoc punctiforme]MBD2613623.1 hypothetical protein [Nostoc punctiforme FACHB-252]